MVTGGHTRLRVLLCILLVASGALAGCTDKDKEDAAPAGNPFVMQKDRDAAPADQIQDYVRYYTEDAPKECQGCVRLETASREDTPPAPEAIPGVAVPWPAVGDQVGVQGLRREATGPELGPLPFATEEDAYRFDVVYEGMVERDVPFTESATFAHFRVVVAGGGYPVQSASFAPNTLDIFVDPATRAAVVADAAGQATAQPEAYLGLQGYQRPLDARHMFLPAAEHVFWLGSHLWGRTWFEGDTLEVAWTPPGSEAPALWYDYEVTKAQTLPAAAADEPAPTHSHGHSTWVATEPRTDLRVRVEVHDHFGKMRRWELRFDGDSPYPVHMRLIRDMHASVDPSLVPGEIVRQTTHLVRRGTDLAPWPSELATVAPTPRAWGALTYRIDERVASPALDTLPLYPLRAALDDLMRLEPSFAEWWGTSSEALLVDARLEPRLVTDAGSDINECEWRLTFLDGTDTRAWTVARMSTMTGVLAPAAHRAAASGSAEVPATLRYMDREDHVDARLSAGDDLKGALEWLHLDGRIDRAHYTLTHTTEHGLGGVLLVGQARIPPTADELAGARGGHVVQDLQTGAIVEALVFTDA